MRRTQMLFVRVSEYERSLIVSAATERRLSVADYIRMLVRSATGALPLSRPAPQSLVECTSSRTDIALPEDR